jgi:hypothetical protein
MQNVEIILLLVLCILWKFCDVNKAINLDQLSLTKQTYYTKNCNIEGIFQMQANKTKQTLFEYHYIPNA